MRIFNSGWRNDISKVLALSSDIQRYAMLDTVLASGPYTIKIPLLL
jgi:hypothetical protein